MLDIPRHGFVNFHYAPLPQYRGSKPLFWMMKDGVKETGVTVHRMTAGEYDDGPVLFRSSVPIYPQSDNPSGVFCTQLGFSGVELTGKLLDALRIGDLQGGVQ